MAGDLEMAELTLKFGELSVQKDGVGALFYTQT